MASDQNPALRHDYGLSLEQVHAAIEYSKKYGLTA